MAGADRTVAQLIRRTQIVDAVGDATWQAVRRAFPGRDFDRWADALETLVAAGLGGSAVVAYARASPAAAAAFGAEAGLALAPAVLQTARSAGPRAAEALLLAAVAAARLSADGGAFRDWLAAAAELAEQAPEAVGAMLERTETILAVLDGAGLRRWILTGLRLAGGDAAARLAYFALADDEALRQFEREAAAVGFSAMETRLAAFLAALWGLRPIIRAAARRTAVSPVRRTTFNDILVRMPESFPGFSAADAEALYYAAIAHVGAHMMFTPERFPVRTLKPLQVALVSLVEDARVEALARRELPGLGRLWGRLHVAAADGARLALPLMARLARSLADPAWRDDDPWVRKGREMFFDLRSDWGDPALSRRIGGLLGNDLGQMRVQFNAKTYVVQPPYRDDNLGIWDFGEPDAAAAEEAEIVQDMARIRQTEDASEPHQRERAEQHPDRAHRAARLRAVEQDAGVPVARYPEWDHALGAERPHWTTVLEVEPRTAPAEIIDRIMRDYRDVEARIARMIRSAKVSRPERERRRREGDRLDVEACIRAAIERRAGIEPDPRVYETSVLRHRDLSVLLLLDISESTKDCIRGTTTSILSLERAAAALLAHAMSEVGDPFAVRAFCSNGRSEVRYHRIKDFARPFDTAAKARLAGLRGGFSTRIGAAIRHAGAELGARYTHRRLLLIVTDGEPSDIDVADRAYLVEDARKAVQGLGRAGVDVFCVGLDGGGDSYLSRIFGRRNVLLIDRVAALPERLPMLYFRLTH